MPLKTGELTRTERAFIEAYMDSEDREKAEKKARLAPRSGYGILARPAIQAEILARQTARLTADALPVAVKTLIDIMGNAKAPAGARVQAAKVVLDRALPQTDDGRVKDLHELTPDEVAAAIAALETQASQAARDVTPPDPGAIFG